MPFGSQKEGKAETRTLSVKGKRGVSNEKLLHELVSLGFNRIDSSTSEPALSLVETESIEGKPHSFFTVLLKKAGIDFEYSITPETNKKARSISAMRLCLDVLAISKFTGDASQFYSETARSLESSLEFADSGHLALKSKCEALETENERLGERNKELLSAGEKNTRLLLEVEKLNSSLAARARKLEGISDEALLEELLEWLRANQGQINVAEFARLNSVSTSRVEEGLDMLMKRGDIARER